MIRALTCDENKTVSDFVPKCPKIKVQGRLIKYWKHWKYQAWRGSSNELVIGEIGFKFSCSLTSIRHLSRFFSLSFFFLRFHSRVLSLADILINFMRAGVKTKKKRKKKLILFSLVCNRSYRLVFLPTRRTDRTCASTELRWVCISFPASKFDCKAN